MTPDLAARKVMVASYMYYVLDESPMTDHEFDHMCQYVADHWEELQDDRKFCLGSPEDIRASGAHIKFTVMCVDAARTMYYEKHNAPPAYPYPHKWKRDRKLRLRYVTC